MNDPKKRLDWKGVGRHPVFKNIRNDFTLGFGNDVLEDVFADI